jgi:serine kinase of HPr protein (carbohydrate metabolism regulator)
MTVSDIGHPPTIHASAVVIGGQGVLIRGLPRAGKTTLGQALVATRSDDKGTPGHRNPSEKFSLWVSDDRTIVAAQNGQLIATAPQAIAGRIADRKHGIMTVPFAASTILALIVDLDLGHEGRTREMTAQLLGQRLPLIRMEPVRPDTAHKAAQAVHAALGSILTDMPPSGEH